MVVAYGVTNSELSLGGAISKSLGSTNAVLGQMYVSLLGGVGEVLKLVQLFRRQITATSVRLTISFIKLFS